MARSTQAAAFRLASGTHREPVEGGHCQGPSFLYRAIAVESPVDVDCEASLVRGSGCPGTESSAAGSREGICFGGCWLAVPNSSSDVVDVDGIEAELYDGNMLAKPLP